MLRVTAPGGRAAIGDVAAGSRAERFLNAFVDTHTDQGHAGRFRGAPESGRLFERAGGHDVRAEAVRILWRFPSPVDAGLFCRELFGLRTDTEDADLDDAILWLGLAEAGDGWRLPWDMVFASAAA
jgi:hypothetical protein